MDDRMDLITEPRQIVTITLDAAICGTVNDTNSFWGLVPSTTNRTQYATPLFLQVDSVATTGTRWKPRVRGNYTMHFFAFVLNPSADDPATVRAGFVIDASTPAQQTNPSNVTGGIFGLDALAVPSTTLLPNFSGAISMTAPVQVHDLLVGDPTRGWLHLLLSDGAEDTPTAVVAAGSMITITRTSDIMGSYT
jgi:hypothetical protein